jgi:hypothetical protein
MRSVGIVCGYDLDDDLGGYVRSVAPLIAREKLDVVILSGGRTSPRSHHSEAWVMAQQLSGLIAAPPLVLEEHAMTTLENLIFARGLAEQHADDEVERFVVFCDAIHRRKVTTLSRLILGARTAVRAVEHQVALRVRLFEPLSHIVETVVALAPRLRKYLRAAAMRIKGVTGEPPRAARAALEVDDAPHHRRVNGPASRP